MGLVALVSATGGVAWPPLPGAQPTSGGRAFTRSTPSYGISFIKCRGLRWQPHRLAVFVSLLCRRVSSTWQLELTGQRKSSLGLEPVCGPPGKKRAGCPGTRTRNPG